MHFCKATTASRLGHNINKTKNVENEMPYQLHFKTAQEHNTQTKTEMSSNVIRQCVCVG